MLNNVIANLCSSSQTKPYQDIFKGSQNVQNIHLSSTLSLNTWIHISYVFEYPYGRIYINGTLHTHHTLNQLPKQNSANVLITPKGGFNGKVGLIDYYPTLLDQNDIYNLSLNTPKLDTASIGVVPPYFAQTWWLQKY